MTSLDLWAAFCIATALPISAKWLLLLFNRFLFCQVEKSSRESGGVTSVQRASQDGPPASETAPVELDKAQTLLVTRQLICHWQFASQMRF